MKFNRFSLFLTSFIVCGGLGLGSFTPAYGDSKNPVVKHFDVLIHQLLKGQLFLGGKPPKLEGMSTIQEIKKDGRVYYRLKAVIDRASGDTNGSLVLFRAKTYGHAFAKLFGIDPANKRLFDTFFPKSIDKTKFPPVLMVYKYELTTRNSETGQLVSGVGKRKRKGPDKFTESFSQGLPPGTHELRLDVSVDVGDHPVKSMWDAIEWVEFFMDPAGAVIDSLAESTEYFSVVGLAKAIIMDRLENRAINSRTTYNIEVLAKVPDLKGMQPSKAVEELQARLLTYTAKNTRDCTDKQNNKVVRQHPAPGKRLKKDKSVTIAVCRKDNEQPTPTPAAGDTYAAWIRPDRLTCCTGSDGTLTYAYQSGLQKTMPSNGILLQGGFSSVAALEAWVCNRPVYYHYWAKNWARINGFIVSQLPCDINA